MKLLVVLFLVAGIFSACSKAEAEKTGEIPQCSANGDGKCGAVSTTPEKRCKCTENGGTCECPNGQCRCTENGGTCECCK